MQIYQRFSTSSDPRQILSRFADQLGRREPRQNKFSIYPAKFLNNLLLVNYTKNVFFWSTNKFAFLVTEMKLFLLAYFSLKIRACLRTTRQMAANHQWSAVENR